MPPKAGSVGQEQEAVENFVRRLSIDNTGPIQKTNYEDVSARCLELLSRLWGGTYNPRSSDFRTADRSIHAVAFSPPEEQIGAKYVERLNPDWSEEELRRAARLSLFNRGKRGLGTRQCILI